MTERIKKSLIPMKIGTRLCVLRCHPNWQNKFARLCDVLSYVPHCNGCAPSAATCFRFRAALISPFTLRLSAAISPSATLWKTTCKATTLTRRFSMMCKLYRAFGNLSIVFSKKNKKNSRGINPRLLRQPRRSCRRGRQTQRLSSCRCTGMSSHRPTHRTGAWQG